MDKTDVILCQLLLLNSRLSYRELADKLNLSTTAVHARIRSLVEMGVIRRFFARVNAGALNAVPVLIFGVSGVAPLHDLNMEFRSMAQYTGSPSVAVTSYTWALTSKTLLNWGP